MNRSLLKYIKEVKLGKKDWRKEVLQIPITIPIHVTWDLKSSMWKSDDEVQRKDEKMKIKGKEYADNVQRAEACDLAVGYQVLLKHGHLHKLTTPFNPDP